MRQRDIPSEEVDALVDMLTGGDPDLEQVARVYGASTKVVDDESVGRMVHSTKDLVAAQAQKRSAMDELRDSLAFRLPPLNRARRRALNSVSNRQKGKS